MFFVFVFFHGVAFKTGEINYINFCHYAFNLKEIIYIGFLYGCTTYEFINYTFVLHIQMIFYLLVSVE